MKKLNVLCLLILFLAASMQRLNADAIDNLKPGEWYEVPNTHLVDVAPTGGFYPPGNVILPWCGAALDTKRSRVLIWGGGHTDYCGNEIYGFSMDSLKWSRLWGPTPFAQIQTNGDFEIYLDSNPGSRHTYDGLVYLPDPIDALWACSGALWQNGGGSDALWLFKFGTNQWERKTDFPGNKGSSYWQTTGYDSARGLVISQGARATCEYNPEKDTWTQRYYNGAGWWNDKFRSEIDPVRRVMVTLGRGNCHIYNLDTYVTTDISHTCVGDTEIISADAPGLSYDSQSGELVAWNGGTSVYKLDIVARRWTRNSAAPTNSADPGAPPLRGVYSKWRYIPSRNVFFIVNDRLQNVFLYRSSGVTSVETKSPTSLAPAVLMVSPSPVTGRTVVRFGGAIVVSPIQIFDPSGRRIAQLASGSVWDTRGLPAGIYLAIIKTGSESFSRRIVVTK